MQTLNKSNILKVALIAILLLIVGANIAVSFAYFTDKVTTSTTTLQFGTIKIEATENNWFSTIKSKSSILKPGDVAVDGVSFGLGTNATNTQSQPFYIRAKCVATTTSTNSEVQKVCTSLNSTVASYLENSNSAYKWSAIDNNYFYLLGSDNQPLAVTDATKTYYFIKSTGLVVDKNLAINGLTVNSDTITITVSIEAIQKANLVADSGSTLQNKIKSELDLLVGNN